MRLINTKSFTTLTHSCGCTKHKHSNCEFVFIIEGVATNTVNGHSQQVCKGDIFFISQTSSHSIIESVKPYRHRDVYISADDLKKICEDVFTLTFYDYLMSNEHGIKLTISENYFLEITKTFEELEILYNLYTDFNSKSNIVSCIKANIINLLGLIYKQVYWGIINTKTWITDFVQKIQQPEIFTMKINEIIALSHYSRTYFCNLFKATYNLPFKDYLQKLKINYAKVLLNTTDKEISAIANDCGYETQSHFTQFFKKITGTTPLAYRKNKSTFAP